mmetsp:Transcript_11050/g.13819  ORF Transcript_11050/g.13819 Transcript_11050/m.13819 type:complete len:159 (+) Transcript_11050:369-845(+)|eukprot:CAMPEP_0204850268 /NCGR_PEP_ID=MMETSP1347-20130617/7830_1 /ASSEMBLY_ACC=CAM_ASM_000690 /TAXON_ID=215587 /ORGANISM="Aplanochytrium stocchinoi, Strain GSBS06" /LENGTH=158 /DNA_ID=CAMNT_0051993139 /DNA_START=225 /DNA_END=701 /DNA_ORIENTATION=-
MDNKNKNSSRDDFEYGGPRGLFNKGTHLISKGSQLARRHSQRVYDRLNHKTSEDDHHWHDYVASDLPIPGSNNDIETKINVSRKGSINRIYERLNRRIPEDDHHWHDYMVSDLPIPGSHDIEATSPKNVTISRKESVKKATNALFQDSYDTHHVFFTP